MRVDTRKYMFKLVAFSALTKAFAVLFPLITQRAIDAGVEGDFKIIFTYIAALIVLAVVNAVIDGFDQYTEEKYKNHISHTYRLGLRDYISGLEQKQYDKKTMAEYVSMFNNNISMVVEKYYIMILNIIKCIFVVIFSISALFSLNNTLSIVIVITSGLTVLNPFLFRKSLDRQMQRISEAMKMLNNRLNDFLKGYQVGKVFSISARLGERLEQASENLTHQNMGHWKAMLRPNIVSVSLTYFRDIFIVAIGIHLMLKEEITVGGVFAAVQLSNLLCVPAVQISYLIGNVLSSRSIKHELDGMVADAQKQKEVSLEACKEEKDSDGTVMQPMDVLLEEVSFSYKEKQVLDHVSLRFEAGKKYLLIGASGSGKSTVLKLLARLYEDYSGEILADSNEIRSVKNWKEQISMGFQENTIFQDTLRNNMTLWGRYDSKKMEELIDTLQLRKITSEYGLDVECTNSEKSFSGGEQQRISLVRTFLKPAWLLLLDEATSALDHENYLRVEEYILSLRKCTVINVSHKIEEEIADRYDQIILLENGSVKCVGTYQELLNTNSDFRSFLYKEQE